MVKNSQLRGPEITFMIGEQHLSLTTTLAIDMASTL
jgi:hypothetical protein